MKVYLQKRPVQKYAGYDVVVMDLITKRKIEALPELIRVARAALTELCDTESTNQELIDELDKAISEVI